MCGKTKKHLHVERILTVHVAFNCSKINLSLMRNTRNTKRQMNIFSSHPTDEDLNKGAADESKIYDRH